MNLIKPHDDRFYYKYEMIFDGNVYFIRFAYRTSYGEYKPQGYVSGWRWTCYIRMFFWRLNQHRELKKTLKQKSRQLDEPKVIIP